MKKNVVDKGGFALISSLFFALLVALYAVAVHKLSPVQLASSAQLSDKLRARQAAEVGASYARSRLRGGVDWQGRGNGLVIDEPTLKIHEQNGLVRGWLKDPDGAVSGFKLSFGGGARDAKGLRQSLNNAFGLEHRQLPGSDSEIPPATIALFVKGVSGKSLNECQGPEDLPASFGAASVTVTQVLGANHAENAYLEAITAGGDIDFDTEGATTIVAVGSDDPRIRSKGRVSSDNELVMEGLIYASGGTQGVRIPNLSENILVKNEDRNDDPYYSLGWDAVPKLAPDDDEALSIDGGVYVLEGSSLVYYDMTFEQWQQMAPEMLYSHPDAGDDAPATHMPPNFSKENDFGSIGLSEPRISHHGYGQLGPRRLRLTGKVRVDRSQKGVEEVVFTELAGRSLLPGSTEFKKTNAPGVVSSSDQALLQVELKDAVLSSEARIVLLSDVLAADSAIVTESELVIASSSATVTQDGINQTLGLSLYSQDSIRISSLQETISEIYSDYSSRENLYGPIHIDGLIYAWKNIEIDAGSTENRLPLDEDYMELFGSDQHGDLESETYDLSGPALWRTSNLTINGAIVSYGGDPKLGTPGNWNSGKTVLRGSSIGIRYDESKLTRLNQENKERFPLGGAANISVRSFGFDE